MLTESSVVILNYTKYSDSSIIVNAISEQFGRITFLVYGINSKARNKLSAFQPLQLLDVQIYFKANNNIQKLKEYKVSPPLFNIFSDVRKSTIALFLAELLSKTIKESFADKTLFLFIRTSILVLDELDVNLRLFIMAFMLKLARFLGFSIETGLNNNFYDYQEGTSVRMKPAHNHYVNENSYNAWIALLKSNYDEIGDLVINNSERNKLFDSIIDLYAIHILGPNKIKSYAVLKEVFN